MERVAIAPSIWSCQCWYALGWVSKVTGRGTVLAMVLKLNARSNYFRAMASSESTPAAPARRRKRPRRRSRGAGNSDPHAPTRVQILKSAAAAFRRLGYHGATVEQIAAALHMKKGNLYYYFDNKEEILFACHQYSLDRLIALLGDIEESPRSPAEKLRTLVV